MGGDEIFAPADAASIHLKAANLLKVFRSFTSCGGSIPRWIITMLTPAFFQRDVLTVARDLIGVELVWHGCSGIIVETEAYAVQGDEAAHTASRPSAREFVKANPAGGGYVDFNYGMYWLFNLLVKGGSKERPSRIRPCETVSG